MDLKQKFIDLYRKHITRPGSEELLEYLLSPASDEISSLDSTSVTTLDVSSFLSPIDEKPSTIRSTVKISIPTMSKRQIA